MKKKLMGWFILLLFLLAILISFFYPKEKERQQRDIYIPPVSKESIDNVMALFWKKCRRRDIVEWVIQESTYYNSSVSFFTIQARTMSSVSPIIHLSFCLLPKKNILIIQNHDDSDTDSWNQMQFMTY